MTSRPLDPALLSKLLDCSPGLVMVVDGDLQIRWVNAATGFTLGYAPEDAIGRSILEFLDPEWDEAAFRSIGTALASEGLRLPTTFRVISADGSTSMMEVTANSQFHDPDINGIELAWDRPPSQWPRNEGGLIFDRKPLDFAGLLAELRDPDTARLLPPAAPASTISPSITLVAAISPLP